MQIADPTDKEVQEDMEWEFKSKYLPNLPTVKKPKFVKIQPQLKIDELTASQVRPCKIFEQELQETEAAGINAKLVDAIKNRMLQRDGIQKKLKIKTKKEGVWS